MTWRLRWQVGIFWLLLSNFIVAIQIDVNPIKLLINNIDFWSQLEELLQSLLDSQDDYAHEALAFLLERGGMAYQVAHNMNCIDLSTWFIKDFVQTSKLIHGTNSTPLVRKILSPQCLSSALNGTAAYSSSFYEQLPTCPLSSNSGFKAYTWHPIAFFAVFDHFSAVPDVNTDWTSWLNADEDFRSFFDQSWNDPPIHRWRFLNYTALKAITQTRTCSADYQDYTVSAFISVFNSATLQAAQLTQELHIMRLVSILALWAYARRAPTKSASHWNPDQVLKDLEMHFDCHMRFIKENFGIDSQVLYIGLGLAIQVGLKSSRPQDRIPLSLLFGSIHGNLNHCSHVTASWLLNIFYIWIRLEPMYTFPRSDLSTLLEWFMQLDPAPALVSQLLKLSQYWNTEAKGCALMYMTQQLRLNPTLAWQVYLEDPSQSYTSALIPVKVRFNWELSNSLNIGSDAKITVRRAALYQFDELCTLAAQYFVSSRHNVNIKLYDEHTAQLLATTPQFYRSFFDAFLNRHDLYREMSQTLSKTARVRKPRILPSLSLTPATAKTLGGLIIRSRACHEPIPFIIPYHFFSFAEKVHRNRSYAEQIQLEARNYYNKWFNNSPRRYEAHSRLSLIAEIEKLAARWNVTQPYTRRSVAALDSFTKASTEIQRLLDIALQFWAGLCNLLNASSYTVSELYLEIFSLKKIKMHV